MMKVIQPESSYKYLRILEADRIKQCDVKEKTNEDYMRPGRNILVSKRNARNMIVAIYWCIVTVNRYEVGIMKWTEDRLKEMDRE